jgi:hypothetical protein
LETLELTEQDWQQLDASHVWNEVLLPYMRSLENDYLKSLCEVDATPEQVQNLAGRLQAIAVIRGAPRRYLDAYRFLARRAEEQEKDDDGTGRRETLLGRFRRGLRTGG